MASLKEDILAELGEEFEITKVQVDRDAIKGQPGTTVKVWRKAKLINEWFFAEINKMNSAHMVRVIRSYLRNDSRS